MRKAPERSQECSDRKMRLVRAPVANSTAIAADEAGAFTVMENISEHSTQNTAAAQHTDACHQVLCILEKDKRAKRPLLHLESPQRPMKTNFRCH